MLLTPAQFREYMADDVALSDDVLSVMLDANEAAINKRIGAPTGAIETVYAYGLSILPLRDEPASITTVTDYYGSTAIEAAVDDDYRQRGAALERVSGGWGNYTVVEYLPVNRAAERIVVLVELMKCDLNYEPGLSSQAGGGAQESYATDHLAERERILDRLRQGVLFA